MGANHSKGEGVGEEGRGEGKRRKVARSATLPSILTRKVRQTDRQSVTATGK